jgi:hypothetical protein
VYNGNVLNTIGISIGYNSNVMNECYSDSVLCSECYRVVR